MFVDVAVEWVTVPGVLIMLVGGALVLVSYYLPGRLLKPARAMLIVGLMLIVAMIVAIPIFDMKQDASNITLVEGAYGIEFVAGQGEVLNDLNGHKDKTSPVMFIREGEPSVTLVANLILKGGRVTLMINEGNTLVPLRSE